MRARVGQLHEVHWRFARSGEVFTLTSDTARVDIKSRRRVKYRIGAWHTLVGT